MKRNGLVLSFILGIVAGIPGFYLIDEAEVFERGRNAEREQRLQQAAALGAFCSVCGCACGDPHVSWTAAQRASVQGCGNRASIQVRLAPRLHMWIGEEQGGGRVRCTRLDE